MQPHHLLNKIRSETGKAACSVSREPGGGSGPGAQQCHTHTHTPTFIPRHVTAGKRRTRFTPGSRAKHHGSAPSRPHSSPFQDPHKGSGTSNKLPATPKQASCPQGTVPHTLGPTLGQKRSSCPAPQHPQAECCHPAVLRAVRVAPTSWPWGHPVPSPPPPKSMRVAAGTQCSPRGESGRAAPSP